MIVTCHLPSLWFVVASIIKNYTDSIDYYDNADQLRVLLLVVVVVVLVVILGVVLVLVIIIVFELLLQRRRIATTCKSSSPHSSMELNVIVFCFVLHDLGALRSLSDEESLRIVSRGFQRSLYDVILKPEAIRQLMLILFREFGPSLVQRWENIVPEPWFHPWKHTQFGPMRDMPVIDHTRKSCTRRLFIYQIEDIDVFIWFLAYMTPLTSSQPYHCGPDADHMENEFTWYCIKLPALRALRWYLRAAVQHTNMMFVWDSIFEAQFDYEGVAFGHYHRHCLSWRFKSGAGGAGANFAVLRRLRGKQAAQHHHFVNSLITIYGNEVSDQLWHKVLHQAALP